MWIEKGEKWYKWIWHENMVILNHKDDLYTYVCLRLVWVIGNCCSILCVIENVLNKHSISLYTYMLCLYLCNKQNPNWIHGLWSFKPIEFVYLCGDMKWKMIFFSAISTSLTRFQLIYRFYEFVLVCQFRKPHIWCQLIQTLTSSKYFLSISILHMQQRVHLQLTIK